MDFCIKYSLLDKRVFIYFSYQVLFIQQHSRSVCGCVVLLQSSWTGPVTLSPVPPQVTSDCPGEVKPQNNILPAFPSSINLRKIEVGVSTQTPCSDPCMLNRNRRHYSIISPAVHASFVQVVSPLAPSKQLQCSAPQARENANCSFKTSVQ